jgi:UDP-N-acetylmuramate dehydrogenase
VDDSFARTIREVKERRRETQPLTQPSGGSTFANPEGDKAWRLLEAAGLRGEVEGGARYSEVHANFIVNDGEATATDIEALIRRGKERVEGISGIVLREEVCRLDPEGWAHDKEGE